MTVPIPGIRPAIPEVSSHKPSTMLPSLNALKDIPKLIIGPSRGINFNFLSGKNLASLSAIAGKVPISVATSDPKLSISPTKSSKDSCTPSMSPAIAAPIPATRGAAIPSILPKEKPSPPVDSFAALVICSTFPTAAVEVPPISLASGPGEITSFIILKILV